MSVLIKWYKDWKAYQTEPHRMHQPVVSHHKAQQPSITNTLSVDLVLIKSDVLLRTDKLERKYQGLPSQKAFRFHLLSFDHYFLNDNSPPALKIFCE